MASRVLDKKIALVTGAGRGIGRIIAHTLAGAGASVVLTARTPLEIAAVRTQIEADGGVALDLPADVTSENDVKGLIHESVEAFGGLDIVVNNAGQGIFGPLEKMSVSDWDQIMAVNARGPFLVCRESIPHLRQRDRSFIVNIASVVGVRGYSNQSAYSASKHALVGMTRALGKEVQDDGIVVHLLCPGGVETEMVTRARPDLDTSVLMKPQDIADVLLFLVTRRGKAVIDELNLRRLASTPFA